MSFFHPHNEAGREGRKEGCLLLPPILILKEGGNVLPERGKFPPPFDPRKHNKDVDDVRLSLGANAYATSAVCGETKGGCVISVRDTGGSKNLKILLMSYVYDPFVICSFL